MSIAANCLGIWTAWILYNKIKPQTVRHDLLKKLQKHSDWKRIKKTEQLLVSIYKGIHADRISKMERKRRRILDDTYIYGEIDFLSFFSILEKVRPQPGEIFYDLGSGSGRAVFTAALNYDFSKAIGIEFLKGLYLVASRNIEKAKQIINTHDRYFIPIYLNRIASIGFINGNLLDHDISDGDIIFINATCFHYYLWQSIIERLTMLKSGSRIIVTSKKIDHPEFTLVDQSFEVMSWGLGAVNIYSKK